MWSLIGEGLEQRFRNAPSIALQLAEVEQHVLAGKLTPTLAATRLLAQFLGNG